MRRFRIIVVVLAILAMLATGCARNEPTPAPAVAPTEAPAVSPPAEKETVTDGLSGTITVAGSSTVQPLAEVFAEAFTAMHPAVRIEVQGGGSGIGVKSAGEATTDLGMASREIRDSEKEEFPAMQIHVVALDGIAIVAHPGVAVDDLTLEQVRDIFAGNITNWSEVGGPDRVITVVSREEGSGTRGAFEELVMGSDALIAATAILQQSNGAVRTTVATTPDAIAYLSFGYLDESVKTVAVDGVAPTEQNALSGAYTVIRPLNMLTPGEPSGLAAAWLEFMLSSEGQAIVSGEGYLPVK